MVLKSLADGAAAPAWVCGHWIDGTPDPPYSHQSFHGIWSQVHSFLAGVRMCLWLPAWGRTGVKRWWPHLVQHSWGLAPSAWGQWWPPPHIPPVWSLLCPPRAVVARQGAQGSYPPWEASDTGLTWHSHSFPPRHSGSDHYRNKIWQLHQSGLKLAHRVKGSDYCVFTLIVTKSGFKPIWS